MRKSNHELRKILAAKRRRAGNAATVWIQKFTLQLSGGNLLKGEARNVGPLAGVFDGDA